MSTKTYDAREMKKGKCGRCGCPNLPQYLWCDACEDMVVRRTPTSPLWDERSISLEVE
jgi:hypothetical protein